MQTISIKRIVLVTFVFISNLTCSNVVYSQNDKFIVVLDAGHGGKDPGATKNGYKEAKIALKVTLEIGKQLEKHSDIKVVYTRKDNRFIELYKRADIANKADADLFVSIHCNSVNNSKPYGTETWVLGENNDARNFEFLKRENEVIFLENNHEENYEGFDPSSPESTIAIGIEQEIFIEQSIALARKIENEFVSKVKRKSRGLKQGSLLVIRNTYMPSVLVELGFISNKTEGAFLNSKNGQSKMGNAIKNAILDYKKELDQNVGNLIPSENEEFIDEDAPEIYKDVVFKVQIAASSKDLAPKSYNFNGLSNISKAKKGKLYKYYHGSTSNYTEIKRLKEDAKTKGYTSSFIVAFKDGEQVDLTEVLKAPTN